MSRNTAQPVSAAELPVAYQLDPSTQAFANALQGSPTIYTLAPAAARAVLTGAQSSARVTLPEVANQDCVLEVGPTGRTKIRMVGPVGVKCTLPGVVYVAAFLMWASEPHLVACKRIDFQATVFLIVLTGLLLHEEVRCGRRRSRLATRIIAARLWRRQTYTAALLTLFLDPIDRTHAST